MFRSDRVRPGELKSDKMPDLLIPTSAATPVTIGKDVYLAGGWTDEVKTDKLVQVYNMDSGHCRTLPPSPQYRSKAVAIDGNIVLIGGCDSSTGDPTDMVSTWMAAEERWTQALPPMKIKRYRPGVLLLHNHLFVFGGMGEDKKTYLGCFELLDLATCKEWMKGDGRLPKPLHSPQLGVFGDYVMLYGGFTSESADTGTRACYEVRFQKKTSACSMHWTPLNDAPYFNSESALLTNSQDPVLICGYNRAGSRGVTGAIHRFQISGSSKSGPEYSWQVIGELSKPRLLPTVVAVDDRSFLVLGGGSSAHPIKSVELIIRS